jgi:hypothetical protein
MAFLDMPSPLHLITVSAATTLIDLGNFTTPSEARGLKYIRLLMFFKGDFSGLTMRLQDRTSSPNYSDTITISDIDAVLATDSNWLGWVRFDFNGVGLATSTSYDPKLNFFSGYTLSSSLYAGVAFDFPDPIYGTTEVDFTLHPAAMQIFTERAY